MLIWLYLIAGVLAACVAAAGAWALLSDSSRGRRRCPKCFHSMDPAIGLVCPECGLDAREERRLFRTRRRWKLAAMAVVLLGMPAVLTAGLARLKQTGGWSDLPNWVVVHLMWAEDAALDQVVGDRIASGELTRRQSLIVVREARERFGVEDLAVVESGVRLLRRVPTDSYGYSSLPTAIARPTLEELEPTQLFDALSSLVARDPAYEGDFVELLAHLKDAEFRAVIALIERLKAADPSMQMEAADSLLRVVRSSASGIVRRFPGPPTSVLNVRLARFHKNGFDSVSIADSLATAVSGFHGDASAIEIWAQQAWERGVKDADVRDAERLPELWLWCRLDEFGPRSWPAVRDAGASDDPVVREYAIYLLSAYPWSRETEELLRAAIHSPDRETYVRAFETAAKFGLPAKPLTADILELLASLEGAHLHSELLYQYRGMGGSDEDFRNAVVHRLDMIVKGHFDQVVFDPMPKTPKQVLYVNSDLWYLGEIALVDERSAALCRRFLDAGISSLSIKAAIPYAATSRDRSTATRHILDCTLDPTPAYLTDRAQEALRTLILMGWADSRMVIDHYERANAVQLIAFFGSFRDVGSRWQVIEPYLPLAREAAARESEPTLQDWAEAFIARYEASTKGSMNDGK